MGEWRPIDSAPKDGRFLMLHVPKGLESGVVTVGAYWKADERAGNGRFKKGNWDGWLGMDADIASSWCEPTHWMPLPEPPALGHCPKCGGTHVRDGGISTCDGPPLPSGPLPHTPCV